MNTIQQICILSKDGVCLLDLRRVLEAAQQKNFRPLVDMVASDIKSGNSTGGEYFKTLQQMGVVA